MLTLAWSRTNVKATARDGESVFEPISPSGGFDNLSPTSCPQCGGRRKVGGEDLIHSTGLHKTLSGPDLRAPWLTPRGSFFCRAISPSMPTSPITRRLQFNAAHRVHNPALSDDENTALFGKCNNPNWHGHNYTLDVSVTGAGRRAHRLRDRPRPAESDRRARGRSTRSTTETSISKSTSCATSIPTTENIVVADVARARAGDRAGELERLVLWRDAEQLRRVRRQMTVLERQLAVVTGASRGIGLATATMLVRIRRCSRGIRRSALDCAAGPTLR